MVTPKISIIIPVYETEKYVLQCLESIHAQTYQDYEVIIVNDGSSDNSEALITKFIQDHNLDHFHLISQENHGVSFARNTGLRHARGEWIAFIDSDDWVEPNFLKDMVDAIGDSNADYCLTQLRVYYMASDSYEIWCSPSYHLGVLPEDLYQIPSFDYSCGRMYKRSIIEKYQLAFDSRIKVHEDNAFNFDYITKAKKYVCVQGDFYNYRRGRAGSLTRSFIRPIDRVHFTEHCQTFCNTFDFPTLCYAIMNNISLSRIMWNVLSTSVIMDILDSKYKAAHGKLRTPLAKVVLDAYIPLSRKAQWLQFLCKHFFPGLVILVKLYYGNFETLRKHKKFFYFISHK